jgi:uncharacterized protein (UPF0332 family)
MIDQTLRTRIDLEIKRAIESFESAKLLLKGELFDECVSSAYYAMFHFTKALLLTIQEEPSTHQGLISLFGLNFIKTSKIEREYNDMLIDAKESRESGDYDAARSFTKEEAIEKVENAEKFNQRILQYLKSIGFENN